MADKNGGYIGNSPSDSSVRIARQSYTSSGITTDFTFSSGYTPGYIDAYLNGIRLIETDDYVATDGTTISLSTAAQNGDTLELIAYKAFNVSEFTLETGVGGNFDVSNNLTVDGNLDVDGTAELDVLNVAETSTFNSNVTFNDTTTFTDIATFSNTATFSGTIDANGLIEGIAGQNKIPSLYATLSDLPSASDYHGMFAHVHATGRAYYAHGGNWTELVNKDLSGHVGLSNNLDVEGHTELETLNIAGVSTFAGNIDANGNLDVDGQTNLDLLNVAELAIFSSNIDANGNLDVDGHTELDDLNVAGVSTFAGSIDANGNLDVDGYTELDDLNVSGVSTFVGNIDANGNLDVSGYTELDDVNISGVVTSTRFSGPLVGNAIGDLTGNVTGNLTGNVTGNADTASNLTGSPSISVTNITASGNVSIAGTLTYEDVTNVDSVGIITARSGINVTGVVTATAFHGDGSALTGIDATQIQTNNTSVQTVDTGSDGHVKINIEGSEKVRVDSSGRVLIGTTTEGHTSAQELTVAGPAHSGITIRSGSSYIGSLFFSDATSSPGEYSGFLKYSHLDDFLAVGVDRLERLRILDNGNVGIGSDNPQAKLSVSGNIFVNSDSFTGENAGIFFSGWNDYGAGVYGRNSGNDLVMNAGGSEKVRVTSVGNIGIGTDSPSTKLHVHEGSIRVTNTAKNNFIELGTDGNIEIKRSGGGAYIDFADSTSDDYDVRIQETSNGLKISTGGQGSASERLRIDSDGKVRVPDNGKFVAGVGDDLEIYHDGTNNIIKTAGNQNLQLYSLGTGAVEVMSDAPKLIFNDVTGGAQIDFSINANTGVFTMEDDTNSDTFFKYTQNDAVEIYHNNSKKFETTTTGATVTGTFTVSSSARISGASVTLDNSSSYGNQDYSPQLFFKNNASSNDFYIWKDNSNNMIEAQGSDDLIIRTRDSGSDIKLESRTNQVALKVVDDAAVELYHGANGKKFETTTTGAKVTGALEVTQEYPTIRPTLDLNFAATKTLDHRITFTRDSVGTYYDELGVIRYASNNVPRFDHDPTTGESLGLLIEESRTNLVSYSEYTGTTVQTSGTVNNWGLLFGGSGSASLTPGIDAPDGSNNAVRFTNNNTGVSILRLNIDAFTPNGSDTYIISFWARAISGTGGMSCDLADGSPNGTWTDQLVANKWVRVIKSGVPSNASKTFLDLISNIDNNRVVDFWGVQLEKGAFVTSYIPTNGSTVTRGADVAGIKGTNFTDFYNQTEGTIFSNLVPLSDSVGNNSGTGSVYWSINANSGFGDGIYLSNGTGSTTANLSGYVSSNSQLSGVNSSTISNGVDVKLAHAFKQNDFIGATDGTLTSADTSGNLATNVRLVIGNNAWGGTDIMSNSLNAANAHVKRFSYYPKRLPNAQLQGLTQQ